MSERDDDLIDALRADIADAAATPPRAGFESRLARAVHEQRPPRVWVGRWLAGPALAIGTAAVLAAAVGTGLWLKHTGSSAPAQPAHPSPSAAPQGNAGRTFVVLQASYVDAAQSKQQLTVRFVDQDGRLVHSIVLNPTDVALVPTVGGDRFFYVKGNGLYSAGADGTQRLEGSLTGVSPQVEQLGMASFAVSPDGQRWVWAVAVPGSGNSLDATVYMAGRHEATHVVMRDTSADGAYTLTVLAWREAGIVLAKNDNNVGGGPTFFENLHWRKPRLLDPDALAQRVLPLPTGCASFEDVAADGSFTCVPMPQRTVMLVERDGTQHRLVIPGPVNYAGYAMISPDGRRVAVGVATAYAGDEDPFPAAKLRTEVIDVASGKAVQAGPSGRVPLGWLADGTLVLETEVSPGEYGGREAGAALLRPDGSLVDLGPGAFIGLLDPTHSLAAYVRYAEAPYGTPPSPASGSSPLG